MVTGDRSEVKRLELVAFYFVYFGRLGKTGLLSSFSYVSFLARCLIKPRISLSERLLTTVL